MSCAECKHWRTAKDPNYRDEGVCVKFTAEYRAPPGKSHVEETKRTKRRRGRTPRESGSIYATWGFDDNLRPGEPRGEVKPVSSLFLVFKTKPGFSCALFEARKRKRRLPVVTNQALPATRLERVAARAEE